MTKFEKFYIDFFGILIGILLIFPLLKLTIILTIRLLNILISIIDYISLLINKEMYYKEVFNIPNSKLKLLNNIISENKLLYSNNKLFRFFSNVSFGFVQNETIERYVDTINNYERVYRIDNDIDLKSNLELSKDTIDYINEIIKSEQDYLYVFNKFLK